MDIIYVPIRNNCLWILKYILNQRQVVTHLQEWNNMLQQSKYQTSKMNFAIKEQNQVVMWRKLLYGNIVKPRVMCTLWLACQDRLATKERLSRFILLNDECCCFCREKEIIHHLLVPLLKTKDIWEYVLAWLQINHKPLGWKKELKWMVEHSKGKAGQQPPSSVPLLKSCMQCGTLGIQLILVT